MTAVARQPLMLPAVLVFTMTASSFQIFAFAVLAVEMIDDLGLSRTALGLLGSLNTLVGAVSAPVTGRLTDRIGPRQATVAVLVVSGVGMAIMAASDNWPLLALSACICGIPQGWGNPTTNALIAERIPAAARGTITGIKQSGVQVGIFLSGLTLPGLAVVVGWRGAALGYAAVFGIGALVVAITLGPSEEATVGDPHLVGGNPDNSENAHTASTATGVDDSGSPANGRQPLPRLIWLISAYALALGMAGGAIGRFFPLWANEVVGLSTVVAGGLVAIGGLLGIMARIAAGRLAQDRISPARLLAILAVVGGSYCIVLLLTQSVGSWILWPAAVLYSIGIGAWNAVAMLAIIVSVPRQVSGRASGVVMVGFLGGLTIGSPLAGAVVDQWGTYQPVWVAALMLSLVGAVLINPGPDRSEGSDGSANPTAGAVPR